jgi:MFS family permease
VGAIIGPLAGVALLSALPKPAPDIPFREIFLLSLVPGLAAPIAFAMLVHETKRQPRPGLKLASSLRELPAAFRRFLVGVGIFGCGDFSPTLLTLAAATLLRNEHGALRAAELAALLYVIRNSVYAAASWPIGAIADRAPKIPLLAAGFLCAAAVAAWIGVLFSHSHATFALLTGVFVLSGIFAAAQDTLEGAIPPDLTSPESRGTVYGTLGAVNGVGDLAASALVGTLWTAVSPSLAFFVAAAIMAVGALALLLAGRARVAF